VIRLLWSTVLHQDFLSFITHPTVNTGQLATTKECNEKSTPSIVKLTAECLEMPCKPLCYSTLFVCSLERKDAKGERGI